MSSRKLRKKNRKIKINNDREKKFNILNYLHL